MIVHDDKIKLFEPMKALEKNLRLVLGEGAVHFCLGCLS